MNAHGSDDADGNAGQEAASQSYSRRHPGEPPSTPNQLSAMSASVPMPSRQGNFMGDGWLALHQPRSNAPQQTFKTPAHPSGMKNRTMGSSDRGGLASARKNLLAKTPFHKDMAPTFHRTPGAPVSDRNFGNTSASVPGRSHWGFGIPSGGNDDRQKAANRFGLRAFQEPRNAYEDGGSRLMKPAGGNPLGYGFGDGQRQSGGPGVSRSFNGQSPRGDSSWTKPDFSMSTPIGNRRSDLPFDKGNVLATPSMQSTYPKNSDNSQSFPPRANPMRTTEHVGNAFGFGFSRTINEFNSTSSSGFAAEPSAYSPGYHATGPPLPSSGKGDVPLLAQLKNKFETNGLVDVPIGPSSNNPLAMPPSSSAFNAQSGMNPEAPVFTFPATEQQMPPSPGRGFFDKRLHESERQRNNVGKGSARLPRDAGRGTVGRDMGFDPHHSHPPRQQRQRKATQRSREWQDVNSHALGNNGKRGGPRDKNQKKPQKGKGREDRKKNGRVKHEGGKRMAGKIR